MSIKDIYSIEQQLKKIGLPQSKIKALSDDRELSIEVLNLNKVAYDEFISSRVCWLRNFSNYVKMRNISGNVAECGVHKGDFSYFINKYFPDRTLHLFDPFEGFRKDDLTINESVDAGFVDNRFNEVGKFSDTSQTLVMSKMLFPEMCVIHKGYIPESAVGFNDEFCFVNLDMDLYKPMFEALKIFYPMMVKDGVLLLHDYFHKDLSQSVQKAVEDYENLIDRELCKITIGDFTSIAIIKDR